MPLYEQTYVSTGTFAYQLPTGTAIFGNDIFPFVHGITGSATPNQMQQASFTLLASFLNSYFVSGTWSQLQGAFQPSGTAGLTSAPQAFGDNYVLTPSISGGRLVLALKTIAGGDPSASDKIWFRIGDTKREITAALSLSVPTGTSTFNAGASETAAKDIDFFAYIGWRASDSSAFLVASRIPYAEHYGQFSATPTNEKYGAFSGASPASTDKVENIGRIRARVSASPFVWSMPSGTVINHPIFETGLLDFTSTKTPQAGSLVSGTVIAEKYQVVGQNFFFDIYDTFQIITSNPAYIQFTTPFTFGQSTNFSGIMTNTAVISSNVTSSGNSLFVRAYDGSGFTVGGGRDVRMRFSASLV